MYDDEGSPPRRTPPPDMYAPLDLLLPLLHTLPPNSDLALPTQCSCTEFVKQQLAEILHEETGTLHVLLALLSEADSENSESLILFIRPFPRGPSDVSLDAWAVDKAGFLYNGYKEKNVRLRQHCARTLLVRALLQHFPYGPYYKEDHTAEEHDALERNACNIGQFFWSEIIVDFLLQSSSAPGLARHVQGDVLDLDPRSIECQKTQSIIDFVKRSGVLLDHVPPIILWDQHSEGLE